MLAHVETLVGGVDHEGGVEQAGIAEVVERAPHVVVEAFEHLCVVAHITLVLILREGAAFELAGTEVGGDGVVEMVVARAVFRVEAAYHVKIVLTEARLEVGAVDFRVVGEVHVLAYFHFLRLGGRAAGIVVVEGFGNGEGHVLVFVQVFHLGQPVAVAGLVVDEQDKGARLVALVFHPVDALVGDDVGDVAMLAHGALVHLDEIGVVVVALSRHDVPVVEARGGGYEVPFAYDGGLVACCA